MTTLSDAQAPGTAAGTKTFSYDANATGSASGSKSFNYDENGNLTHDGRKGLEFSWNVLNLVSGATAHDGSSLKYSWLSDGTKVSASEDDGDGNIIKRHYVGSFVFVEDPVSGEWAKESVGWDEGRIFFDVPFIVYSTVVDDPLVEDHGFRDCWYARDHLGNVRAVIDITPGMPAPQILEQSDYLPFGTKTVNAAHASMQANRWRYAGKEEQAFGSLDLGLLDFGARMYDPFTARWTAVDPMAGKYASHSPYLYCCGSPIVLFDQYGENISFFHWEINEKMTIGGSWKNGASNMTIQAVENFAKTEEGYKFLSLFAKAGDKIGSVVFSSDGEYAEYDLRFLEYSNENGIRGSFGIGLNQGAPQFNIQLNINYGDGIDNTLTIGHEAFIHMDKVYVDIAGAHFAANKMENPALLRKKIDYYNDQDEKVDHSDYLNHLQDSRFSLFVGQLNKVFEPNLVKKARINHDKYITH